MIRLDSGGGWERLALPDPEADIWSVTVDPTDRRTVCAGCGPVGVYRSEDDGDTWRKTADPGLPDRVIMGFACRVMRLDVDPNSPNDIYATLEANGTMRSRNGGESWEDCTADLIRFCEDPKYRSRIGSQTEIEGMLDGHALAVSAAAPGTVFLANRMGLFRSDDRGEHWRDIEINRLREPIGKQDQYIAAFGGLTCFRFNKDDSVDAWPLKIDTETLYNLEDNLLLFFTGYSRSASSILKEQDEKTRRHNSEMVQNLNYVKDLGLRSCEALEGGRLVQFGKLMDEHWQ